jgi:hypothetical protein
VSAPGITLLSSMQNTRRARLFEQAANGASVLDNSRDTERNTIGSQNWFINRV